MRGTLSGLALICAVLHCSSFCASIHNWAAGQEEEDEPPAFWIEGVMCEVVFRI